MARRYFRRLKAAYVIVQHYRRYKQRTYVNQLKETFKDAKKMRDYGKRLSWPKENYAVKSAVPMLKMMYARWYSWMILKRIPKEEWPQLRLKVYYNKKFNQIEININKIILFKSLCYLFRWRQRLF